MRVLAIGDLHGKILLTKKFLEKNKIDLIISPGDFANIDKIRDTIFENWLLVSWGIPIETIMGHQKFEKAQKKAKITQEKVMKNLSLLNKKILFVFGNDDEQQVQSKLKNLENLHLKKKTINGIDFIGMQSENFISPLEIVKIEKLFKTSKNPKIFLTHEPPYNTKLDLIKDKKSPRYGQHVGGQFSRYLIKKFQPKIVVCGHMHENKGLIKMGKTLVVNSGFGSKGYCAIIDVTNKKFKVTFARL